LDLDTDEFFALPQIKELIEGLTDCAATFLGDRWQATPKELDRIAKPIARVIARKPGLKLFLARFSAPAVLVGAIGAYIIARRKMGGAPSTAGHSVVDTASTLDRSPRTTDAQAPATHRSSAAPAQSVDDRTPQTTSDVDAIAREAEMLVFNLARKTMALG
jgi:hypothetical protein